MANSGKMLPHVLYIRYLITRNLDYKRIVEHFKILGIPHITIEDYEVEFIHVDVELPTRVKKQIEKRKYSAGFSKWMDILEIKEYWRASKADKKLIQDIHEDPQVRLAVNALLIKGMPLEDLAQALNIKYSTVLTYEALELYRKIFFNVSRMTRADWKAYLKVCPAHEQRIYFMTFTSPIETVKTEFELPSKVNVSNTLQYLLSKSYDKAKLYLEQNTPDSGKEARAWVKQVIELADRYEKHRASDTTDFSQTLQMEFEYVDQDFPSPDPETLAELEEQRTNREEVKDEDLEK